MPSIDVSLSFTHGRSLLGFTTEAAELQIEAHWTNDRLTELVRGVLQLVEGGESVSCRWQGPVHEGHFVDLVRDPEDGISIAISQFVPSEAVEAHEIWNAERGTTVFSTHPKFSDFVLSFTRTLRVVRTFGIDPAGLIVDYPRAFPQTLFETLEDQARRFGYKPRTANDLLHDSEASSS